MFSVAVQQWTRFRRPASLLFATTLGSSAVVGYYYCRLRNIDPSEFALVRFGRAAHAALVIIIDYKKSLYNIQDTDEYYPTIKSKVHLRSAARLYDVCCRNGGVFIKVGQYIGSMDYLLPEEYVQTMKVLHQNAPATPIDQIHRTIRDEFNVNEVSEIFPEFDPEPLGSASLAQVHRATLLDGTEVAVKVQHPRVRHLCNVDVLIMEFLVNSVAWLFPDFKFMFVAEQTKKNLPQELDFIEEGKNAERVSKILKQFHFVKVPGIHWHYTTGRVLTMEYCQGGKVDDRVYMKEHNINVNQVSRYLGRMYSEMIFVQGYIHCDPHPGNILVNTDPDRGLQIVLLDHGLYQTLTDEFRLDYCCLWKSLLDVDVPAMKVYSMRLGVGSRLWPLFTCMITARSWQSVSTGINKKSVTSDEDDILKNEITTNLPKISTVLNLIPRQMLLLFKTNEILRGIEHVLATRADSGSFIVMMRCCVQAVGRDKLQKCRSVFVRSTIHLSTMYSLWKLSMYELFLWCQTLSIYQHTVPKLLASLNLNRYGGCEGNRSISDVVL